MIRLDDKSSDRPMSEAPSYNNGFSPEKLKNVVANSRDIFGDDSSQGSYIKRVVSDDVSSQGSWVVRRADNDKVFDDMTSDGSYLIRRDDDESIKRMDSEASSIRVQDPNTTVMEGGVQFNDKTNKTSTKNESLVNPNESTLFEKDANVTKFERAGERGKDVGDSNLDFDNDDSDEIIKGEDMIID